MDDVRVHGTLSVIEQLPGDDALAGVPIPLDELDGDLPLRLRVECQLYEAGGAAAGVHKRVQRSGFVHHGGLMSVNTSLTRYTLACTLKGPLRSNTCTDDHWSRVKVRLLAVLALAFMRTSF